MGAPKMPDMPPAPPPAPDVADQALLNARTMERRKQLGLMGRMSTFLTTAQGDKGGSGSNTAKTLLGS